MQCNMMQGDGNTEQRRRKTNTGLSTRHQVIERVPQCTVVMHVFRIVLLGARTVHLDDNDECEWSLSVCLASFFGWLVRRGSFFEVQALIMLLPRCIVSAMVSKCQVHPHFMVAALIFFTKTQGTVGG